MLLSGCMKNSTELSLNKGYLYARTDLKIILTSSYNNSNSCKNKSFCYRKINGVQGNYDDWQLYRPLFIICKNRAHELYVCGGCFVNFSLILVIRFMLRWLNTVLAVSEYRSFAKLWQERGCSSQAETWQVKNIMMKDFDWQAKFDVFVVSMATWTIEYNLKISLLLSLHKIRSLDFPINSHTAYYN